MLRLQALEGNCIRVDVSGKLGPDDFTRVSTQVDALMQEHGSLRLLVDATRMEGWENSAAADAHVTFVRGQHKKITHIALIAGHAWQHWVVWLVRLFVRPKIKIFSDTQVGEAMAWLNNYSHLNK